MEFDENKAIYLQIADTISEKILKGNLSPDQRIPSVRDFGVEFGINPNTVMRSYEYLQNKGVIYNKRGLGFFVSPDAKEVIFKFMKKEFISDELPRLAKKMKLLGITKEEILQLF